MSLHLRAFAIVAASLLLVTPVRATPVITAILDETNVFNFSNTITVGYGFRVSSPQDATALGMWDLNADGFTGAVDVGLWDGAGSLLGAVTLGAGTSGTLIDGFRYVDLVSAVPLQAETLYVLGGFRASGVQYLARDTRPGLDFLVAAGVTIVDERASSSFGGEPTVEFPDFVFDVGQALVGPNALLAPIPEPVSAALLGLGLLGIAGVRRTRGSG